MPHLQIVAISVPDRAPIIRPVSYAYDERSRSIVFRSGRGTKLTALLLSDHAAFEVDVVKHPSQIGSADQRLVWVGGRVTCLQQPEIGRKLAYS